jgi:class 3 adenylate cyclase/pimeloyl-ACP methyl ester carboxylesterase
MAEERVQRRLAAILAADVVGYSRLMGNDEEGTLARLKALRREVFDPATKRHGGRVFKTTGDGALVEFPSAIEAVKSAVAIQKSIAERDSASDEDRSVRLRIGISLGDVIVEGGDLFGNGVNVAARMEGLADPGGICISGNVREHLKSVDDFELQDLGPHVVKNIADPVSVFRVLLEPRSARPSISLSDQVIRFCTTADGVQIAYSTLGQGSPVIMVSNWLTHLELDLALPSRRGLIEMLAGEHLLVRFDPRGNGLSDLEVKDISFEAFVSDVTAVTDDLDLDRFALVGNSQGAAVAAAYAARHPDRITHLVLYGSYARGRRMRGSEGQIAESEAFVTMIREGWGKDIDAYVRMFGSFFMPDASTEQLAGFTDLQRKVTPPENAARIQLAIDNLDISGEISEITAPTLVLHVREDARAPFDEGRRVAAAIPGARFVPLEGRNHLMLPGSPALRRYLEEIGEFLRT